MAKSGVQTGALPLRRKDWTDAWAQQNASAKVQGASQQLQVQAVSLLAKVGTRPTSHGKAWPMEIQGLGGHKTGMQCSPSGEDHPVPHRGLQLNWGELSRALENEDKIRSNCTAACSEDARYVRLCHSNL